ncbi:MAG: prepilin-type N-terminal cleavage/methylation domain-containing protein [Syntrophorhabdaceae bacterium]|nr:prepilin-type N-terminal cleavage/methylation domain-containing protein [Syntrophorhabdaceae bacterium]
MLKRLNKKGFSLIEVLIVSGIGLFVLMAALLLYTGSLNLFKDVKTISDNIQTKVPSIELVGRYFDRWGVNVLSTGSDCTNYPPSNAKCITVTPQTGLGTGITCDEVIFFGNIHGTGFVRDVSGTVANLVSCRLSTSSNQNCYYLWRNGSIQNDASTNTVLPLSLSSLSPNNADCSTLTSGTVSNASANYQLSPSAGSGSTKTLQAGDIIQRSPHKIRLYCAPNANDASRNWLYVDLTDTALGCTSDETASPIAPVDTFQVTLLTDPSGNSTAARVTVTFRSQSGKYSKQYDTHTVTKTFGR